MDPKAVRAVRPDTQDGRSVVDRRFIAKGLREPTMIDPTVSLQVPMSDHLESGSDRRAGTWRAH